MARYKRRSSLTQAKVEATPRPRRTVADRWTDYLGQTGHVPVVHGFLDYYKVLGLTDTEAMFIIHLMSYKWDKEHPYPTYAKIANVMNLNEASLRRMARKLQTDGILKRIPRGPKANIFDLTLLFNKLEEKIREEQPELPEKAPDEPTAPKRTRSRRPSPSHEAPQTPESGQAEGKPASPSMLGRLGAGLTNLLTTPKAT